MLQGHPKGLALLFMTEFWERMSYYILRAVLPLYLIASVSEGGFGWTWGEAAYFSGVVSFFSFILPIPGGYIADHYLGQRFSAMVGSLIMLVGYFVTSLGSYEALLAGIALVCVGVGLFKPCLTAILGMLYEKNDPRRDDGYNLFYMGINLGAMASGLISAYVATTYGFTNTLLIAGIGMLIAYAVLGFGAQRILGDVGKKVQKSAQVSAPMQFTGQDKERLKVFGLLFLFNIIFFMTYEQSMSLVTIFAKEHTDRTIHFGESTFEIPVLWFFTLNPFFIAIMAPVFNRGWARLAEMGYRITAMDKVGIGLVFTACCSLFMILGEMSVDTAHGQLAHWIYLALFQMFMTCGELCVSPVCWSAVTRLIPQGSSSLFMGIMLSGSALGGYAGGYLGSFIDDLGVVAVFGLLGGISFVAALVLQCIKERSLTYAHGAL